MVNCESLGKIIKGKKEGVGEMSENFLNTNFYRNFDHKVLIKISDHTPHRVWSISVQLVELINRLPFDIWSIIDRLSILSIS